MPTICQFFGITIRMYYDDHPPAHFHAYYGKEHAVFEIQSFAIREGYLPRRVVGLVLEWALEHREQLLENWRLADDHAPLIRIEPLE